MNIRLKTLIRPALSLFVLLSLVTGLLYPLLVTAIAGSAFPQQASGSLVERDGKPVGSLLIGQNFSDPKYFWGRPSATGPQPNNASASGGSNLGPNNPALIDAVSARIAALKAADPENRLPVPVELVTASASGLDPEISPAAAAYQLARVAKARTLSPAQLAALVERYTQPRQFGVLGEARVNVLALNLALDQMQAAH
ncbi:potassium-transporting ATPase subunit KdpC [Uliginosibacterium sediminicola]|uniref:Potassium-transporting ATPase KdpC subunit n=1 Tax=Uliginosibacterium sediminicola TaxID=2024550 RepID=A0ABU9Z004_9RHOO